MARRDKKREGEREWGKDSEGKQRRGRVQDSYSLWGLPLTRSLTNQYLRMSQFAESLHKFLSQYFESQVISSFL